jgi:hypothetical protein
MMSNTTPVETYKQRIASLTASLQLLKKKKDLIAWSRFFSLLAAALSIYYLRDTSLMAAILICLGCIALFLRLLVLSANNNEKIANLNQLIQVNATEIRIATGDFHHLPAGNEFLPPVHEYAHDLDIFGRASLYQYINRTTSEQGNHLFAGWLRSPAEATIIPERQAAVKELAPMAAWREQLQGFGLANKITISTEKKIKSWLETSNHFSSAFWKVCRIVLPLVILSALVLHIVDMLPSKWFYLLVLIFFVLSALVTRKVLPIHYQLDKIVKEISSLSNSLSWIEKQEFNSPLLIRLRSHYADKEVVASRELKTLKDILDRMDFRLNPIVFFFLNTFLFWDLQQVILLEKWKDKNRLHLQHWFETLGEIEALTTLGTLYYNHPDWTFPVIEQADGLFIANQLGHPLIAQDKRIASSFSTNGIGKIALVTGSNMAGKSTFLRSVGINIVMAMMGAPVCASALRLAPVKVMSSMRVTDNLEESTSTFYAELKKLKQIIDAVNRNEKIFLLLDEILRGTNSLDRYTGSKALIKQLITHRAVGILATHDLELAKLESTYPDHIHNYHFDVQVEGEELYFDYKLKEGVCQSLNASILMKKIGIEL